MAGEAFVGQGGEKGQRVIVSSRIDVDDMVPHGVQGRRQVEGRARMFLQGRGDRLDGNGNGGGGTVGIRASMGICVGSRKISQHPGLQLCENLLRFPGRGGAGNICQQLRTVFDQLGHLTHIAQELVIDEIADFGQGAIRADDGVCESLIVGAAFRVVGQAVGVGAGAFQGRKGFDEVGVGRENVCFEHLLVKIYII